MAPFKWVDGENSLNNGIGKFGIKPADGAREEHEDEGGGVK